jgi:hypothetical protein
MTMTIEMIPFTKDHLIPKDGKYLVKTVTTHLKNERFLQATCTLVKNGNVMRTAVDVTNQNVTEISKEPIL